MEEELMYDVAAWVAQIESKKLEESEKSPHDYFEALEEAFLDETALYRCFNNKDELLYVGVSYSAINRFSQHKTSSKWAKDVVTIYIEPFDSRDLALAAEKKAIKTEYPKHNDQHNNGERPQELGHATVCSFKRRTNGKVVTGLRIDSSLDNDEPDLVTYKMDEQIFDKIRNAWKLYNVFCFKPWEDKVIEIEIKALMSIFDFKYRFDDFEYLREVVIEPALKLIKNTLDWVEDTIKAFNELEDTVKKNVHCSGKYLTYTTKKTDGFVTYVVFVNNKEPTPQPTYLEVRADKSGIDREDLRTYEMVRRKLYPDD